MVKIKLDDVLDKQNKSKYWLSKQINSSIQNLSNLSKGKTTSINFDTLEKICKALNCTPNDIIEFTE